MITCPHCNARVHPLWSLFRWRLYRCGSCGHPSKLPWKHSLVLDGVNLFVLLFSLGLPWHTWQRLLVYLLVSLVVQAAIMHLFMRFEPVKDTANSDVV